MQSAANQKGAQAERINAKQVPVAPSWKQGSKQTYRELQFSLPKGGKMDIHRAISIYVHCVSRLGLVSRYRPSVRTGNGRVQIDFLMIGDDNF